MTREGTRDLSQLTRGFPAGRHPSRAGLWLRALQPGRLIADPSWFRRLRQNLISAPLPRGAMRHGVDVDAWCRVPGAGLLPAHGDHATAPVIKRMYRNHHELVDRLEQAGAHATLV
jgi:hypothetical protein